MLQCLKTVALLAATTTFIACAPADSSAGLFDWMYYPYGYDGYGYSTYYPPMGVYQSAYAPLGGCCGQQLACCQPACNPCGCSPCGAGGCGPGGCPGGNCQVAPLPAGQRPTPIREDYEGQNRGSNPRQTFEPPVRGNSGTAPADDFERGNPNRPGIDGTNRGTNSTDPDFGTNPNNVRKPSSSLRPEVPPTETTIQGRKPAETTPVNDETGPNLDGRSTSKPIAIKERLSLRSSLTAPRPARNAQPGTDWSAKDTKLARQ